MNEIKVGIRYSRLADIFVCYFYARMNSDNESAIELAINDVKENWILFGAEMRNDIINISGLALQDVPNTDVVAEFIKWAKHYFDAPQETGTQRPLVDILSVVNMAKVNHKAGD